MRAYPALDALAKDDVTGLPAASAQVRRRLGRHTYERLPLPRRPKGPIARRRDTRLVQPLLPSGLGKVAALVTQEVSVKESMASETVRTLKVALQAVPARPPYAIGRQPLAPRRRANTVVASPPTRPAVLKCCEFAKPPPKMEPDNATMASGEGGRARPTLAKAAGALERPARLRPATPWAVRLCLSRASGLRAEKGLALTAIEI